MHLQFCIAHGAPSNISLGIIPYAVIISNKGFFEKICWMDLYYSSKRRLFVKPFNKPTIVTK